MVGAWHRHESDRAAARHHRGHVDFTLPFELVGFTRRVGDDERHSPFWQVQQRGECRDITSTKLQPFIRMAEPNRLKIIEPAQERSTVYEIVWQAKSSLPARAQHHRREMCTRGATGHMNTQRITTKITRMRVKPGHRRAALAHDFGEGDVRS